MKKIKLLTGVAGLTAAISSIAIVGSCGCNPTKKYDIEISGNAKVKSQEIDSNGNLVITLEATTASAISGVENVKIGSKKLTITTDYTYNNGVLTIKKGTLAVNTGKITFTVKTGSVEAIELKWNGNDGFVCDPIDVTTGKVYSFTFSYNKQLTSYDPVGIAFASDDFESIYDIIKDGTFTLKSDGSTLKTTKMTTGYVGAYTIDTSTTWITTAHEVVISCEFSKNQSGVVPYFGGLNA